MTEDVARAGAFDSGPSALIFADSDAGGMAASAAVRAAGGRIVARLGLEDAVDRLNGQAAMDAVIVDLTVDHGALADRLLDLLSFTALRDNRPVIVTVNFALVDCVEARLHSGPVTVLCDPDLVDRVSALALAWGGKAELGVSDVSAEADNARLRRLAEEVNRIARKLAQLSNDRPFEGRDLPLHSKHVADVQTGFTAEPGSLAPMVLPSAAELRAVIRCRRLRNRFFDPTLFADPAWDMLLDLMAARLDDEEVSISSLCIAAAVPSTTALRWIRTMTDLGLFNRRADPLDGRRIHVSLTDLAARAMSEYLAAAKGQFGMIL